MKHSFFLEELRGGGFFKVSSMFFEQSSVNLPLEISRTNLLRPFLKGFNPPPTGGGLFSFLFFGDHILIKFEDSRHIQVARYTVFDEESELHVKHKQILEPGGKT